MDERFLWARGEVGVAVWCQIGTLVVRSISFLFAFSVRPSPLGERVRLAGCVLGSFRRGSCGAFSSSLEGFRWCVFRQVNLFLRSLSELLSFPNHFDQLRVLRRRDVCEEISCLSCQLRLGFSVAARVEAAGVLDDLGLPWLLLALGCRLLFLSYWCRCDGVWWFLGASSPNKARPSLFRIPWSQV